VAELCPLMLLNSVTEYGFVIVDSGSQPGWPRLAPGLASSKAQG